MTRIAALSDVHGNVTALEAVLADVAREKPDHIVVAGDLVLNGPEPAAAVDALRSAAGAGTAVIAGNTDVAVADFDYAAAFPWMTDGVPDAIAAAAEWAHDALGDERVEWLRALPRSVASVRTTTRSSSSATRRPARRPRVWTRTSIHR
jgi:3',5'-cyclic AMP phosphodiesterase CpdA